MARDNHWNIAPEGIFLKSPHSLALPPQPTHCRWRIEGFFRGTKTALQRLRPIRNLYPSLQQPQKKPASTKSRVVPMPSYRLADRSKNNLRSSRLPPPMSSTVVRPTSPSKWRPGASPECYRFARPKYNLMTTLPPIVGKSKGLLTSQWNYVNWLPDIQENSTDTLSKKPIRKRVQHCPIVGRTEDSTTRWVFRQPSEVPVAGPSTAASRGAEQEPKAGSLAAIGTTAQHFLLPHTYVPAARRQRSRLDQGQTSTSTARLSSPSDFARGRTFQRHRLVALHNGEAMQQNAQPMSRFSNSTKSSSSGEKEEKRSSGGPHSSRASDMEASTEPFPPYEEPCVANLSSSRPSRAHINSENRHGAGSIQLNVPSISIDGPGQHANTQLPLINRDCASL